MVSCYFLPVIIEFSRCIGTYSSTKFEKVKGKCQHNLYFTSQEQHTVSRYVGVNGFLEILCRQIFFTDEKIFIEEINLSNTSISPL